MTHEINDLLAAKTYAVVGASRRPEKYGSLVCRALKAAGKTVYAVNPRAEEIDGEPCYPSLGALPSDVEAAIMVVPPDITETAVAECARLGIGRVWMQPGAESEAAVTACQAAGITVVHGGPCLLVALRTQKFANS